MRTLQLGVDMTKLIAPIYGFLSFLMACGGSTVETGGLSETDISASTITSEPNSDDQSAQVAPTKEDIAQPPVITDVHRDELDRVLAEGPAKVLAMVQTDSYKEHERFLGFRIVAFRIDAKQVLGLREGDVVTRVNGLFIERPEQYFQVFEKLKTATEISFRIIRNGEPMVLTTPILP